MRTRENIGKQLDNRGGGMLDDVRAAALSVAGVVVDAGANDQFAFVRLTCIAMHGIRHHDGVENGLHRLRNKRLKRVTF